MKKNKIILQMLIKQINKNAHVFYASINQLITSESWFTDVSQPLENEQKGREVCTPFKDLFLSNQIEHMKPLGINHKDFLQLVPW